MKNVIFIRWALFLPMILQALSAFAGINFKSVSFEEAKKIASKENKLVFIDAYATWCGPCKWLSQNVFTDEAVGKLFEKTFVSLKIDMETDHGLEIDELYNVTAYPTLLAIRPDGSLVRKQVGALDVEDLINWVDICLNPENAPYERHLSEYNSGNRELSFLMDFLAICIEEEHEFTFLISEIFKVMPPEGLQNETNMLIFRYFPTGPNTLHGTYFLTNFYQLKNIHGDQMYDCLYSMLSEELEKKSMTKEETIEIVKTTLSENDELRVKIIELLEQ